MPLMIAWHVTAACTAPHLDALVARVDAHPEAQYEGDGLGDSEGQISLRFLTGSPTMTGVKTQAAAAVRRAFGSVINEVVVLTLYREVDGAVYDAATL